MRRTPLVLVVSAILALAACDRAPEPTPTAPKDPTPAASTANGASSANTNAPGSELTWTAPSSWEKAASPGPMRKATYRINGPDQRGAEVSVSQAGGSVMDNVKRWAGQIAGSDKTLKQSEKKVGPYKVTVAEMTGAYQSGMPGAPAATATPDTTLVGAIVELGNGQSLFFKMVGSTTAVTAARPAFDAMVDSVH